MLLSKKYTIPDRLIAIFTSLIVVTGIVIRLAVYVQNRNLFIDEANVARNIYERGFAGLALPLSYEQYAPPIFLWIIKAFALVLGYSEPALRLFPLLAGVCSLFLLWQILKKLGASTAAWYPLALMAGGFIFVHYSAELKQYSCDVLITLSLILLALTKDILRVRSPRFTLFWMMVGSVAIWASMPSVFVLAGVAVYYAFICLRNKKYNALAPILFIGLLWMAQFAFYYFAVLKPQANSDYLQSFHRGYFLFIFPNSKEQLMHNWYVFKGLLEETGGYSLRGWVFNLVLLLLGSVILIRKDRAKAALLLVPLAATLLAAALHQYSLIPRVALFMMPLFLIIMGCGLKRILEFRFLPAQLFAVIMALVCMKNFCMVSLIWHPLKVEEITRELAFMKQNSISGSQLYVHNNVRPAYIYYTQIHPSRQRWSAQSGAHLLWWDAKFDTLAQHIPGRAGFMFTSLSPDELNGYKTAIGQYMRLTDSIEIEKERCYAYIFIKK